MRPILYVALSICTIMACAKSSALLTSKTTSMVTSGQSIDWNKIDSLERQGLIGSALEELKSSESYYDDLDLSDKIRYNLYYNKYQVQLEEEGVPLAINRLRDRMDSSKGAEKAILASLLSDLYFSYLVNHSLVLNEQSFDSNDTEEDIRFWSKNRLLEESKSLAFDAIALSKSANQPLEGISNLVEKDQIEIEVQIDDLYGFIAHRSLDRLVEISSMEISNEGASPAPEELFAPIDEFLKLELKNLDLGDSNREVYQIIQDILRYHKEEENDGLLFLDNILRLKLINQLSPGSLSEERHIERLAQMSKEVSGPIRSYVLYLHASKLVNQANQDTPDGEKRYADNHKKAVSICKESISEFPSSSGAKLCQNLIHIIERSEVNIQVPQVVTSDAAHSFFVQYRNLSDVKVRLAEIDPETVKEMKSMNMNDRRSMVDRIPNFKTWSVDLTDSDYSNHSTELALPKLPLGMYLISVHADTPKNEQHVSYNIFTVSNLSYSTQALHDGILLSVVDRNSGHPVEGVDVDIYKLDYGNRRRESILDKRAKTDRDGFVKYKPGTNSNVRFIISKKRDRLSLEDYNSFYPRGQRGQQGQAIVFTDRNIYRPGQDVRFKVLLLEKNSKSIPSIKRATKFQVVLRDANWQEQESIELTSNEYGSASGTFRLPTGLLNGRMNLEVKTPFGSFNEGIQVEEYKRPRFEVLLKKPTVNYAIGDKIDVEGEANMLAGIGLESSEVTYSIHRTESHPYWRGYHSRGHRSDHLLKTGKITTDEKGKFRIPIEFIVPANSSKKYKPIYSFRIKAEVTDRTGETQVADLSLMVSENPIILTIEGPEIIELPAKEKTFTLFAKNVSGEPVPFSGNLIIEKFKAEKEYKRLNPWPKKDVHKIGKNEYARLFPNMHPYNQEEMAEQDKWEIVGKVEVDMDDSISLDLPYDFKIGKYRIRAELAEQEYPTLKKYSIVDFKNGDSPKSKLLHYKLSQQSYEPGELVKLQLASAVEDLRVLVEVEKNHELVERLWVNPRDKPSYTQMVNESDRGGFVIHLKYTLYGKTWHEQVRIEVPWTNKIIDAHLTSFKDKVEPGAREKWTINLKDKKGNSVQAEGVAAMYDASLDQFVGKHQWSPSLFPAYYSRMSWQLKGENPIRLIKLRSPDRPRNQYINPIHYPRMSWYGLDQTLNLWTNGQVFHHEEAFLEEVVVTGLGTKTYNKSMPSAPMGARGRASSMDMEDSSELMAGSIQNDVDVDEEKTKEKTLLVRENLNETVFFYPDLKSDENGNIDLDFTMGEALTKWRLLFFGHNADMQYGSLVQELETQKELMVFPNAPRFLRSGDELHFTIKVSNLSATSKDVNVTLDLKNVDTQGALKISKDVEKNIQLKGGESKTVSFLIDVPVDLQGLIEYQVAAVSEKHTDAVRNVLPIITNRTLVTETMALNLKGNENKTWTFEKLKNNQSSSLNHHQYSLEYTSSPIWYAIQALPYLSEYPHDCTEQLFNRAYANRIAQAVATSSPAIKSTLDSWMRDDSKALVSPLSKNQDLKNALLEETPWVLDAKDESDQRRKIIRLFDENRIRQETSSIFTTLAQRQNQDGGFTWFQGRNSSRYITQLIIEGAGRLKKMKLDTDHALEGPLIDRAIRFMDQSVEKEFSARDKKSERLSSLDIHSMYARSYYEEGPIGSDAYRHYYELLKKQWVDKSLFEQAMAVVIFKRAGDQSTAQAIVKSLKERSLVKDELGRYWNQPGGSHWTRHSVERQTILIEAFDEMDESDMVLNEMILWLLKNKQASQWKTTKSTAAAVYAIFRAGNRNRSAQQSWLVSTQPVELKVGDNTIASEGLEKGSLYTRKDWRAEEIEKDLGTITAKNPNDQPSWGAVYWQYFEDLDKVEGTHGKGLGLKRSLYKSELTDQGRQRMQLSDEQLKPGDKVLVRIELSVDRDFEFVHMKDLRGSGLEPTESISGYRWEKGLGYYLSIKDMATHFFFDRLSKGTHVFEYEARVVHRGNYSSGITRIESMYAPEFKSHSNSERITVK